MPEALKFVQHLLFDSFFAIAFVNNLDIFVWRIIWDTQDLYLQSNKYFNNIISLLIAYVLIFLVKCLQIQEISRSFQERQDCTVKESRLLSEKSTRTKIVILVISVANINHWRCLWNFTLEYTDHSEKGIYTLACLAFLAAFGMKRLGAFVSSPFQLGRDCYEAAYGVQPSSANHYYYLSLSKGKLAYDLMPNNWQVLLSFLSEFISDVCTIHSWRSFWFFLDLHLYVGEQKKSAWTSLGIGLALYILVYSINKPVNSYISQTSDESNDGLLDRSSDTSSNETVVKLDSTNLINSNDNPGSNTTVLKKLLLHFMFIVCFLGTVCTWRGVWELQLIYCYPAILHESELINNNILNTVYMLVFVFVLWEMDLLASLQSRSSCEDDYFMLKGHFILECNNLNSFCAKASNEFKPIDSCDDKSDYVPFKPEQLTVINIV